MPARDKTPQTYNCSQPIRYIPAAASPTQPTAMSTITIGPVAHPSTRQCGSRVGSRFPRFHFKVFRSCSDIHLRPGCPAARGGRFCKKSPKNTTMSPQIVVSPPYYESLNKGYTMSDSTGRNQFEADRPALRHTCALCMILHLQKNNHITVDLLERGTPKIKETNPMLRSLSCPKHAIPQQLAATAALPAVKLKSAIFQRLVAHGFSRGNMQLARYSFPPLKRRATERPPLMEFWAYSHSIVAGGLEEIS